MSEVGRACQRATDPNSTIETRRSPKSAVQASAAATRADRNGSCREARTCKTLSRCSPMQSIVARFPGSLGG